MLEDLLPAAKDWHLYAPPWGLADDQPQQTAAGSSIPCRTPVWALGRDATAVLGVESVTNAQIKQPYPFSGKDISYEEAKVRLISTLKGDAPWPKGSLLTVLPYPGDPINRPFEAPEHLIAGKRFLAIVFEAFAHFDGPPPREYIDQRLNLDRCSVLDDVLENRAALARGFGMNDHLRVKEF
jgi:hypothetical protein